MKRIVSFIAIMAAFCSVLTACGTSAEVKEEVSSTSVSSAPAAAAPSPTPTPELVPAYTPDWQIEPYLEAAHIVGLPEDLMTMNQQHVFSHLAIQVQEGGGWQFLNFKTGEIFPDTALEHHFFGTVEGKLPFFDWVMNPYDTEQQNMVTQLSEQQGISLAYEGAGAWEIYPPIWFDEQWTDTESSPLILKKYDSAYLSQALANPVNVVLYIEPGNPDWEPALDDPYAIMYYMGDGTSKIYDGAFLVNSSGERIDDVMYEDGQPYREGVAALKLNGKWGYVDAAGVPFTEFCYEPMISANSFSMEPTVAYCANEGFIPVKKDGLCGVIDTQGREVVPLMFEDITSVYRGAVWAKQDGKWGLLNLPTA